MADTADWTPPASQSDIASLQTQLTAIKANVGLLNGPLTDSEVVVTSAATALAVATTGLGVIVSNRDAAITVYVGGAGVGAPQGTPVPPGASRSFSIASGTLYGIITAGTATVHVTTGPLA